MSPSQPVSFKVKKTHTRACVSCGHDAELVYTYGDFQKFGIHPWQGFLLCAQCRAALLEAPEVTMERIRDRLQ